MKNKIVIVVALFAGLITSAASAAEFKVGVVDMQKAIQTSSAGKKAKKEVEGCQPLSGSNDRCHVA